MQTQRLAVRVVLVATAIIATSCAAKLDAGETASEPVVSYDGLLTALRENGSTVDSVSPI